MTLEGAQWDREKEELGLSEGLSCGLPGLVLRWRNKEGNKKEADEAVDTIPIYLNETRLEHVFSVEMKLPAGIPKAVFYQRATALTIWRPPL